MPWTRFDDGWTDQQPMEELSYEARWHYVAMIQFCSRTKRFDGSISVKDARRCSDVPDPEACLQELYDVGLILRKEQGDYVVHRMEEDHAPPVWVRNKTEQNKMAQRRKRAHESGEHSYCLPESCDSALGKGKIIAAVSGAHNGAHSGTHSTRGAHIGAESMPFSQISSGQVSPVQKDLKETPQQTKDPDTWPTDEFGLHWRNECEERRLATVPALMEALGDMSEPQAKKCLEAAFPGRRF